MIVVFIGFFVILALVMLGFSGAFPFKGENRGADIASELRELLLARADGKIGQEEFERRQAAIHASILDTPVSRKSRFVQLLPWMVPAVIFTAALAIYVSMEKSNEAVKVPAPMSSMRTMVPQLQSQMAATTPPAAQAQSNSGGDLNTAVKRLEAKMAKTPNNGDGWLLLARTYRELGQHKESVDAFAKAAALLPPDANLLADWVDERVVANDRKWDAETRDILKRALVLDPKHLKTLALSGSESFDRGDFKQAITYWKRVIAAAPSDSMDVKLAEKNIQEANGKLDGKTR